MSDETGNDDRSKHGIDDIVTRLRAFVSSEHFNPGDRDRIEAADEIEKLRSLIKELLPFMVVDVKAGIGMCKPPPEHPVDDCPDCVWYTTSVAWQKRIDSGQFTAYMEAE